ncbi:MAG: hypothetical protein FWC51_00535 [Proteobacteria bacterium]|nr:hypothetical protein [Pseudomonadota bacterium]
MNIETKKLLVNISKSLGFILILGLLAGSAIGLPLSIAAWPMDNFSDALELMKAFLKAGGLSALPVYVIAIPIYGEKKGKISVKKGIEEMSDRFDNLIANTAKNLFKTIKNKFQNKQAIKQ